MAKEEPLASERVVVAAPMSLAGAFGRIRRLYGDMTRRISGPVWIPVRIILWILLAAVLVVWWAIVICWYILWGIWLVPYRLIRRGSRKRKVTARQHRELLGAIEDRDRGPEDV
jgi:hypothetical protein